jgi:hypothetical protein
MLTSSRTWPNIIQKTMAVVQLRFDGKYAYSTIANINQFQNQISITSCDQEGDGGGVRDELVEKCGSFATNGSRHMNGHSLNPPASPVSSKVCLCELRAQSSSTNRAKRSDSIKVDNWDFIYRERQFLDVPNDERGAVSK